MSDLLEQMVGARLAWTSAALRSWYPEQRLRQHLGEALETEAGWTANAEFGQDYRDQVARVGEREPLAWANRRLDLPGGGWALTGIRFRRRDLARPFVDVIATTAPPTPDGLAQVAGAVVPAYAGFDPLCLRFAVPDATGLLAALAGDQRFGPGCAVDLHVVAGLVEDLARGPRASTFASVSLRPVDAIDAAETVAQTYAALAVAQPRSAAWAVPEDAESLAGCAEEGLLFQVLVGGESAGVVAAAREQGHGVAGFCVQELCLDARHRGRGLAPAVVQHLVEKLPARQGDALWGTIHPDNQPSLRGALSVGRTIVASLVWITPAPLPGMPAAHDLPAP